ncbi:MAG: DUF6036 family nucleotidyltransferase [Acidimicrobiales bacterium]
MTGQLDGPLLERDEIEQLLRELGARAAARGITVEMFLVGGAAMALAYDRGRSTRDLDAVFEPKTAVYEEARRIANERGLPPDWLNDAVKGFMPDRQDAGEQVRFSSEGISVAVASAEYLFAMKGLSARQEADGQDLRTLAGLLGITRPDQGLALLERYYQPGRLTAKTSLFIQSVLGPLTANPALQGEEGRVFVPAHRRDGRLVRAHWRKKAGGITKRRSPGSAP